MNKSFWGSNVILVIGIISLGGGVSASSSLLSAGIYMILGSLAYKSVKKRRLGIVKSSTIRTVLEIFAIAIIIVLTLFTKPSMLYDDPFPNLIIPILAVIAYIIAFVKKAGMAEPLQSESINETTKVVYCTKCGTEQIDGAKFCTKCSEKIN